MSRLAKLIAEGIAEGLVEGVLENTRMSLSDLEAENARLLRKRTKRTTKGGRIVHKVTTTGGTFDTERRVNFYLRTFGSDTLVATATQLHDYFDGWGGPRINIFDGCMNCQKVKALLAEIE